MTEKECRNCRLTNCDFHRNGVAFPGVCDLYEAQRPKTVLDWIKAPDTTAEEIVDYLCLPCTVDAMAAWCDHFESCRDCKIAWLNSRK